MAGQKFLQHNGSGGVAEVAATQAGGSGNENKIAALDSSGKLDITMMPTGVGADSNTITASEALSAGDFVNIHNVSGNARARKADATVAGKEAHGFVLSSVSNGASGTVYFEGTNTAVTGQTPGRVFLSTTAGQATGTAPSSAGNVVQSIGFAISATAINFQSDTPITLA